MEKFFINLVKGDKTIEIPVEISNADVKSNPLGGYDVTSHVCGDKNHLSDADIMALNGGAHFSRVAESYPLAKRLNELYTNVEKYTDYFEWRIRVMANLRDINALGTNFMASVSTQATLACGCVVSVRFGDELPYVKAPNRTEMLLNLGLNTEQSYRWMRWLTAGDSPQPSYYGKQKAEELIAYIQTLEAEKRKVKEKAQKFKQELNEMHLTAARFAQEVFSVIDRWEAEDESTLTKLETAEMDAIDEKLVRVALRAGVGVEGKQLGDIIQA